uniref:Uncharacterized protein n=1 Tax=viral metagenome TaxID=1070528 RepID=A0A6H1ZQI6_9ZZZZ
MGNRLTQKNKNMGDSIMTQMNVEGQSAFPTDIKENDNSTESSTVQDQKETNADQTGSSDQNKNQTENKDGGAENLTDHPRWKERESDWTKRFNDQEERHTAELAKFREDIDKRFDSTKSATPVEVPSWFGGDDDQWLEFQSWNQSLVGKAKDEARAEALNEIETKSAAKQKAIDDATTYFQEQVTALETDKTISPDGVKVDRNKLLKFVLDNDLVDSKGRWNYRAGFQMMKSGVTSVKADATKDRKQIAGATTSENRAETKQSAYATSTDFNKAGNRPW